MSDSQFHAVFVISYSLYALLFLGRVFLRETWFAFPKEGQPQELHYTRYELIPKSAFSVLGAEEKSCPCFGEEPVKCTGPSSGVDPYP